MKQKVIPLRDTDFTPPVVLARASQVIDEIEQIVVLYKRKGGGFSLRRSLLTWEDCAALEAMLRAETQYLHEQSSRHIDAISGEEL